MTPPGAFFCGMRCRYRSRGPGYWQEPERLAGQGARGWELGRNAFYVYALDTDYGHYVGHTWNVGAQFGQHQRDKVPSTAGLAPKLVWTSGRFRTREDAAGFEAALKSWRDQGSPACSRGGGCLGLVLGSAAVVGVMAPVVLVWAFYAGSSGPAPSCSSSSQP